MTHGRKHSMSPKPALRQRTIQAAVNGLVPSLEPLLARVPANGAASSLNIQAPKCQVAGRATQQRQKRNRGLEKPTSPISGAPPQYHNPEPAFPRFRAAYVGRGSTERDSQSESLY